MSIRLLWVTRLDVATRPEDMDAPGWGCIR